jgi:hypothetical protein
MNRSLESAQLFTSKQYLAKAVEYGDLAEMSVGSTKRQEFQALQGRYSVLAVLADNDELLQEKTPFVALSRTRQIECGRQSAKRSRRIEGCGVRQISANGGRSSCLRAIPVTTPVISNDVGRSG